MRSRPLKSLVLFAIIASLATVSACSTLGQPAGPNGTFDQNQQKVFAAASLVSVGLCTDLNHRLNDKQRTEAKNAANVVGAAIGDSVTFDQAQNSLQQLLTTTGAAPYTQTIASLVYAISAFVPPDYRTTIGVTAFRTAVQNCIDIFDSAPQA